MGSNMLHPEEWYELVRGIQNGDSSVSSRLVDRERRFDNFFATGRYKPTATQGASLTASTAASEVYGDWLRIGNWVWVQAQFRSTSAGTLSNRILLSVPPELLIAPPQPGGNTALFVPRGTFVWEDDSTAPDGIITGTAFAYTSSMIGGFVSGVLASTESFIYIGEGAADQIASGDWISMSVCYQTSANPLV